MWMASAVAAPTTATVVDAAPPASPLVIDRGDDGGRYCSSLKWKLQTPSCIVRAGRDVSRTRRGGRRTTMASAVARVGIDGTLLIASVVRRVVVLARVLARVPRAASGTATAARRGTRIGPCGVAAQTPRGRLCVVVAPSMSSRPRGCQDSKNDRTGSSRSVIHFEKRAAGGRHGVLGDGARGDDGRAATRSVALHRRARVRASRLVRARVVVVVVVVVVDRRRRRRRGVRRVRGGDARLLRDVLLRDGA